MESKNYRPPGFSLKLIRLLVKDELVEEIEGNLYEYYSLKKSDNSSFLFLKYWIQVFYYLRPSTFKSFVKISKKGNMFIFNPILTMRNLYRHRGATFINFIGFSLGLISIFLIYFYISTELSYDTFHKNKNSIYRAIRTSSIQSNEYEIGVTSGPFAEGLLNDYPDMIKSTCRTFPQDGLVSFANKRFKEERMLFADPNFFEFFSFNLIHGDANHVLTGLNSVVIDQEIAMKYFGTEDPIGKTFQVDFQSTYIVTGVMDMKSVKSSLDYDMVFNINVYKQYDWFNEWWNNGLITYLLIDSPEDAERISGFLPDFMEKYFGEDFKRTGNKIGLKLEPLDNIYFNNKIKYDFPIIHGDYNTLKILGIVGIGILFIACFNYVNLSIAQSFRRAKEVSMRKVLGGIRSRLIIQFLGESFIVLLSSMIFSILVVELILPIFNYTFGLDISISWLDQNVFVFLIILFVIILLASGLYPALLLSSFKPISVLKGTKLNIVRSAHVRKALVVSQFSISIFLVASTLIISKQLFYLKNKDLGFNKESIVIINNDNKEIRENRELFKKELVNHSSINLVSSINGEPGGFHDAATFSIAGREENLRMRITFVDYNYLKTFGIRIANGVGFSKEMGSQTERVALINQKGLEKTGLTIEEVLNVKMQLPSWGIPEFKVIGIVEDYHFTSLKDNIEPLMIILSNTGHRRYAAKINGGNIQDALTHIEKTWDKFSPSYPITYEFLDQSLDQLYKSEQNQVKLYSIFSGVSIFLACLGILGLASFAAKQRQKEFGIRKVLGASSAHIMKILTNEFLLLVFIASIIAIPACLYFLNGWLSSFAYRIVLSDQWHYLFGSGLMACLIALLTVNLKTYRAAIAKPTDSIKYE